jgi:hypothetical protein
MPVAPIQQPVPASSTIFWSEKMKKLFIVSACLCLFAAGCSQPVLKQDIPVATNPMGAKIYVNGQPAGTTPASVALERNRDHVITVVKDNYRQEDVIIKRSYQKERTYLNAISAGVNSGLFFKDPRMGLGSSMQTLSSQEKTGEAYILAPPAVKIDLTPVSGAADAAPIPNRPEAPTVSETASASADEANVDKKAMTKGLLKIGAGAALTQMKPPEKKVETSSSSKSYVKPDGTRVTEKSSTSVGVGVNPAGLINVIDTLFN